MNHEDDMEYIGSIAFLKELKAGKESTFDFLFRNRYEPLCRFAWSFLGDYTLAEDIVQEIFSNIWKKRQAIDETQSIDSYLYVSVRNACYTHLKNSKKNVPIDVLLQEVVEPETEIFFDRPELQKLWNAIEALPLQCKIIFKLVVLEELKYHEVAEKLGISFNTVKTQMKIAYKTLRDKFSRNDMFLLLILLKHSLLL